MEWPVGILLQNQLNKICVKILSPVFLQALIWSRIYKISKNIILANKFLNKLYLNIKIRMILAKFFCCFLFEYITLVIQGSEACIVKYQ